MPSYARAIVKISGEVLSGRNLEAAGAESVAWVAREIGAAAQAGAELGVVLGGGNILRGVASDGAGVGRVTADFMGMLATVINGLAMRDALDSLGLNVALMSAVPAGAITEPYDARRARAHLAAGRVVVLAGGTGSPFFSTDTAAALRAAELDAGVLLKATKVDGIFDSDPVTNPQATRFDELTYGDVLERRLAVMDMTAVSMCMEHGIPIIVFDLTSTGSIARAIRGERVGTTVKEG